MKFIGQYIQDFIARFRSDVYLEDISTGTIASGGNLGLDSNNKIVKNTVSGGGTTDLTSDVTGVLPIANGGTNSNSAANARTALGVDPAGTDNSTNVTLAGSLDYITLSGQEITRNAIDLAADVTGTLPVGNGGTGVTSLGSIDISSLNNDSGFTSNAGDITGITISDGATSHTTSSGTHTTQFLTGEGIDVTINALSGTVKQVTYSAEDASTSNKGVASFSSDNFAASSGAISIKSGGVDLTDEVTGTLPEGNGGTGVTDVKTIVTRQVFTGNFLDDLGTTKHYIPLVDSPNEQTVRYRHEAAITAPCDGRVASVTIRFENLNTHSGDAVVTVGVEKIAAGGSYAGTWDVEETEDLTVPDTADHDTAHFHFNNDKHFDSAEMFAVSLQSDTDITGTNERFWVSVVIEWDWSTYLGTKGTSALYASTP